MNRSKIFPIVLTLLILIIIIYLFVNIKQPYIECFNTVTDSYGIKIKENLKVNMDSRMITKINLEKAIMLPDEYLVNDDNFLDTIKYAVLKSYDYLDGSDIDVSKSGNKIIIKVIVDKDETLILNNISFTKSDDDSLQIKIINNIKDSSVVSLRISDNYSEGELISHMKNNGYKCR